MWNDEEDNNPYGSFHDHPSAGGTTDDGPPSYSYHPNEPDRHQQDPSRLASSEPAGLYRASTPGSDHSSNNEPPEFISQAAGSDDDDTNVGDEGVSASTRRGYMSRVEEILAKNSDMSILITDAGKNAESGGGYIVYTIKTGV
jgi:hypothetical protein